MAAPPQISSRTQYEILRLFVAGKADREIADATSVELRGVTRTITELASGNRAKARDLVAAYERHAAAVAAARGVTPGQMPSPAAAPAVDPLEQLLAVAAASSSRRLQALGDKVRALVDDLRAAVAREEQAAEAQRRVDELAAELDKAREALRSVHGRPAAAHAATAASAVPAKTVRAWARENGVQVPALGRIPGDVMDAYRKQHEGEGTDA